MELNIAIRVAIMALDDHIESLRKDYPIQSAWISQFINARDTLFEQLSESKGLETQMDLENNTTT
jgi:hypothetical protein